MTQLYHIDPATVSAGALAVDDDYDNKYFRFCTDDPDTDENAYDDFDHGPDFILSKGDTIRIDYLWGFKNGGGQTKPKDYIVTLPRAMDVKRAVLGLLSVYHADMIGQDAGGRFYFIEQVKRLTDGTYSVQWGT